MHTSIIWPYQHVSKKHVQSKNLRNPINAISFFICRSILEYLLFLVETRTRVVASWCRCSITSWAHRLSQMSTGFPWGCERSCWSGTWYALCWVHVLLSPAEHDRARELSTNLDSSDIKFWIDSDGDNVCTCGNARRSCVRICHFVLVSLWDATYAKVRNTSFSFIRAVILTPYETQGAVYVSALLDFMSPLLVFNNSCTCACVWLFSSPIDFRHALSSCVLSLSQISNRRMPSCRSSVQKISAQAKCNFRKQNTITFHIPPHQQRFLLLFRQRPRRVKASPRRKHLLAWNRMQSLIQHATLRSVTFSIRRCSWRPLRMIKALNCTLQKWLMVRFTPSLWGDTGVLCFYQPL